MGHSQIPGPRTEFLGSQGREVLWLLLWVQVCTSEGSVPTQQELFRGRVEEVAGSFPSWSCPEAEAIDGLAEAPLLRGSDLESSAEVH